VFCAGVLSSYERPPSTDGSGTDAGSAVLNDSGIKAVWMLMLALLFKMASTIFTYGIKVLAAVVLKVFSYSSKVRAEVLRHCP